MKLLAGLLLLATLVSCAAPPRVPLGEAAVLEPGAVCHVSRDGGPVLADRGIGGTGGPAGRLLSDRGIGGTGIVGVVTGFASVCVDGLEVQMDKSVPVNINGARATASQLRVGQVVAIQAAPQVSLPNMVTQARLISVRYEVSGPIEAVEASTGTVMVAGQRVMIGRSTWVAGRFGVGSWVAVSGLRQPDGTPGGEAGGTPGGTPSGTIVASRLDQARVGVLMVRGRISREHDITRIGNLVLQAAALSTVKTGTFVSIVGRYRDGTAEVTAFDADPLRTDPTGYFGISTDRLIVQAFVRVDGGMVRLDNGQTYRAGAGIEATGSNYRNAIVWLERQTNGAFTATALHYTSYRGQPPNVASRPGGHGANLVLPPDAPPAPPSDNGPADTSDGGSGIVQFPSLGDDPALNAAPSQTDQSSDGLLISGQPTAALPPVARPVVKLAAGG